MVSVFVGLFWVINTAFVVATGALEHPHFFVRRFAQAHVIFGIILALFAKAFGVMSPTFWLMVGLMVVIDLVTLVPAIWKKDSRPWYVRVSDGVQSDPFKDVWYRARERFGDEWFARGGLAFLVTYVLANLAGIAYARSARTFDVTVDGGNAVLRRYENSVVLKRIDLENGVLLNELSVITAEVLSDLSLERVKLSSLRVEPVARREIASEGVPAEPSAAEPEFERSDYTEPAPADERSPEHDDPMPEPFQTDLETDGAELDSEDRQEAEASQTDLMPAEPAPISNVGLKRRED